VGEDDANSWLPFNGREDLKAAVVELVKRRGGPGCEPRREVVITRGEGQAMLDALLCLTDPGDEVILTDPTPRLWTFAKTHETAAFAAVSLDRGDWI
jgi:aspartate/methionine/tyrosine aminotransferase